MKAKTKLVNGKRVKLTPQEAARIEAEWAANDAKPPEPTPRDPLEELDALEARIKTLETKQPR